MKVRTIGKTLAAWSICMVTGVAFAETTAPKVPVDVKGTAGVKTYLLAVVDQTNTASADLKKAATAYDELATAAGSPAAAAKAHPEQVAKLIEQMRDAYQRIDSYGYEYVEGIVAGVPALMKYDIELDAGVPAAHAALGDNVAPVVIHAGPLTLDREGSLNNFLIEPTVFGTNDRFIDGTAVLPGFDKPVGLPKPELIVALADYAVDGYGRLRTDANAWQPTEKDCFHVVANMTPTLADYFEDWKETRLNGSASGGRFVAVSRLSDMRGIMSSTRLAWMAVANDVHTKDAALADKVTLGYDQILAFINTIETRDEKKPLKIETIDALGSQAKEKADQVTVQGSQAAALVGVDVNSK
jgi:hypothetical protein